MHLYERFKMDILGTSVRPWIDLIAFFSSWKQKYYSNKFNRVL